MPKLVILRGLPGCGKSTYAAQWVAQDRVHRIRVSRDDLRDMLHNGAHLGSVTEQWVVAARDAIIRDALIGGQSVIVDETALPETKVDALRDIAYLCGADVEIVDMRGVPLADCIRRDAARQERRRERKPVGVAVIQDFYDQHIAGVTGIPAPPGAGDVRERN